MEHKDVENAPTTQATTCSSVACKSILLSVCNPKQVISLGCASVSSSVHDNVYSDLHDTLITGWPHHTSKPQVPICKVCLGHRDHVIT